MTKCDRTAVDVQPILVDPEFAITGQYLRGERLVDFDQVDLIDFELRAVEHLVRCRYRSPSHDLRPHAGDSGCANPRHRPESERTCTLTAHEQHGRRTVAYLRGVAGRHLAVRLE